MAARGRSTTTSDDTTTPDFDTTTDRDEINIASEDSDAKTTAETASDENALHVHQLDHVHRDHTAVGDEGGHRLLRVYPWQDPKLAAFACVFSFTFAYVVTELALSMILDSLVLFADGMHNGSDLFSLAISYAAQVATQKGETKTYTFGLGRAEMLGAGANAMFLISLCIFVTLESLPNLIETKAPDKDAGIVTVGAALAGIGVNAAAMIIFGVIGKKYAGGHGHGHSHGDLDNIPDDSGVSDDTGLSPQDSKDDEATPTLDSTIKKSRDLNLQGAFLHQIGDTLSSLIVLIVGIIVIVAGRETRWVAYVDPVGSLLVVALILFSTVPFARTVASSLMLPVPTGVSVKRIRSELLRVGGVAEIHDMHFFASREFRVGTIHATAVDASEGVSGLMTTVRRMRRVLRREGVQHTTIQLEVDSGDCHHNKYSRHAFTGLTDLP